MVGEMKHGEQMDPAASVLVDSDELTPSFDALAAALVVLDMRVMEITRTLPERDVHALVARCRQEAHPPPGHTHNFDVPVWDVIIHLLERELHARALVERLMKEEQEHQASGIKTGDGERE
jgi:hypothetical protein